MTTRSTAQRLARSKRPPPFSGLTTAYMDVAEKLFETRRVARDAADEHQAASDRLAALTASLTMEAQPLGSNDTARKAALEGLKAESSAYHDLAAMTRDLAHTMAQLDASAELLGHTLRALRLRMEWEIAVAHTSPPTNGTVTVAEMIERR